MMESSMRSRGAGPPIGALASFRRAGRAKRVASGRTMGSLAVAQRPRWQLVWVAIPYLIVSMGAFSEGYPAAPDQKSSSDPLPSQTVANLTNSSTAGWSGQHDRRRHLDPSSLSANLVSSTDQVSIAHTHWGSGKVWGRFDIHLGGQGALNITPTVLQVEKTDAKSQRLGTSITLSALAFVSPVSSTKEREKNMTTSSLMGPSMETRPKQLKHMYGGSVTLNPASSLLPHRNSFLGLNATGKTASSRPFTSLSTGFLDHRLHAVAPLTREKPSAPGSTAREQQDRSGTQPSSAKAVHSTSRSSVVLALPRPLLPLAQSNGSSSTDASQPNTVFKGQEPGGINAGVAGLPVTAAAPASLLPSTRWPLESDYSVEVSNKVGTVSFVTLNPTTSPKVRGHFTHQLLETSSVSFLPRTELTKLGSELSALTGEALSRWREVHQESYSEAPSRLAGAGSQDGEVEGTGPSAHDLSTSVALSRSPAQLPMTKTTVLGSWWSKKQTLALMARNASLYDMRHSLPATLRSFTYMAKAKPGKPTVGTNTYHFRSSVAGVRGVSLSRTTAPLDFTTGTSHTEVDRLAHHSSVLRKENESSDSTSLVPRLAYLGAPKEQEVSSATEMLSTPPSEGPRLELKEAASPVAEQPTGPSDFPGSARVSDAPNGAISISPTSLATSRLHAVLSKETSEPTTPTGSWATRMASGPLYTSAVGSVTSPSRPSLYMAGDLLPGGTTSTGTTARLVTDSSLDRTAEELVGGTLSAQELDIPTHLRATASSASVTEGGSLPVSSMPSSRSRIPEATSRIHTEATENPDAGQAQPLPVTMVVLHTSNAELGHPDMGAMSQMADVTDRRAPLHLTQALGMDGTAVSWKTDARTAAVVAVGTADVLTMPGPGYSKSPGSRSPAERSLASLSSTAQALLLSNVTPSLRVLNDTLQLRTTEACKSAPCVKKETAAVSFTGVATKQPVSESKAVTRHQSSEADLLASSRTTLPLPVFRVHTLPLQFHLKQMNYTESLQNKSSESYKKLEREVKLTLNKMLSTYETFLQANILRFLNGSVAVESEVLFQGEGLVPTSSDLIRTIVTAVKRSHMDTFFDWRLDVQSVQSNGFSLASLEPEKLVVSFTALGQGAAAAFGGLADWGPLAALQSEVILAFGTQYEVRNFSLLTVRNSQGDLDISGEVLVNTDIHVDVGWALRALMTLANFSVDVSSLAINGSRLNLQIFPVSFLVTNRKFNDRLLDRSSVQHKHLTQELSAGLMRVLGKYESLVQVTIRDIKDGSLVCHGNVIFHHPAPTSKDVLKTLALSVGPKDFLVGSSLQVDRFSFTVAGNGLEPPLNPGVPGYGMALIVLGGLVVIVVPVLALLSNMCCRKAKMVIHGTHDPEVGIQVFELDNPTFRSTIEEDSPRAHSSTQACG